MALRKLHFIQMDENVAVFPKNICCSIKSRNNGLSNLVTWRGEGKGARKSLMEEGWSWCSRMPGPLLYLLLQISFKLLSSFLFSLGGCCQSVRGPDLPFSWTWSCLSCFLKVWSYNTLIREHFMIFVWVTCFVLLWFCCLFSFFISCLLFKLFNLVHC